MYFFIVNPRSRSTTGISLWQTVKEELNKRKVSYREFLTIKAHHAEEIAAKLTSDKEKHRTIIVLGGDGTLNEVLNGIKYPENVTLGYIPIGSSNDFSRSMHLHKDPIKALDVVLSPQNYTMLDYGIVSFENERRRYMVSSGIGYDAAVCYEANYSLIKKFFNKVRLGKLSYIVIAIKQLVTTPVLDAALKFDDGTIIKSKNLIFSATHIHKYEGGGLMFCPEADPTDGILDVCTANNINKLKALTILPKAYKGNHVKAVEINTYKCKSVHIKTTKPLHIHTDGESCGQHCEAIFSISPDKIKFIAK